MSRYSLTGVTLKELQAVARYPLNTQQLQMLDECIAYAERHNGEAIVPVHWLAEFGIGMM